MSDVNEPTHERLGVFHASLGPHRGRPGLTWAMCRPQAIAVLLLAVIASGPAGCDGASSHSPSSSLPDGGGADGMGQVCRRPPQPSPTLAKACGCDADCDVGERCLDEARTGAPGGVCVRGCTENDAPCPDGFACEELTSGDPGTRACLPRCTTSADCRQGYFCEDWVSQAADGFIEDTVCFAHCSSAADCTTYTVCDPYYGLCGPQQHPGTGDIGAACAKNDDCISGMCIVVTPFPFPDGYCTASCSIPHSDCPAGSACEFQARNKGDAGICLKSCTLNTDCRTDYVCVIGEFAGTEVCFGLPPSLVVAGSGTGSSTVSVDKIEAPAQESVLDLLNLHHTYLMIAP